MRTTRVAFFSADPLSIPRPGARPRLLIDEEVRAIDAAVQAARYRDELEFDDRWATRTGDLLYTLRKSRPHVVHFSGHGTPEGLILMDREGRRQHCVGPAALAKMLKRFPEVRLVVLNACYSRPMAEAVAEATGCAIGTCNPISDRAAITFGVAFYSGIANGESVQEAYDRAVSQMAVDRIGDDECPDLVHRADVDPAKLFLVDTTRSTGKSDPWPRVRWMAGTVIVAGAATLYAVKTDPPVAGCEWDVAGSVRSMVSSPYDAPPESEPPRAGAAELAAGRVAERQGNDSAAFRHYSSAAAARNSEAVGLVGIAYLRGKGVPQDAETGRDWLQRAAGEGDLRGMTALAMAYLAGEGGPKYRVQARHWLSTAAERGWMEAMYRLAAFYRDTAQYEQAIHWYQEAAEAGYVDARVDAGAIYEQGHEGVPRSFGSARCLYESAAKAGSARGTFEMGRLYQTGTGVSRDYDRALEWYRRAAAAGSARAMVSIGMMFQNGWGVDAQRDSAIRWYREAEAAGSAAATQKLGELGER